MPQYNVIETYKHEQTHGTVERRKRVSKDELVQRPPRSSSRKPNPKDASTPSFYPVPATHALSDCSPVAIHAEYDVRLFYSANLHRQHHPACPTQTSWCIDVVESWHRVRGPMGKLEGRECEYLLVRHASFHSESYLIDLGLKRQRPLLCATSSCL